MCLLDHTIRKQKETGAFLYGSVGGIAQDNFRQFDRKKTQWASTLRDPIKISTARLH